MAGHFFSMGSNPTKETISAALRRWCGQSEPEGTALPNSTLDTNLSAMCFNREPAEGQAQAGGVVVILAGCLNLTEFLKYLGMKFGRNAWPLIADQQLEASGLLLKGDQNGAVHRRKFRRIAEQICDGTLDQGAITQDLNPPRPYSNRHRVVPAQATAGVGWSP